MLLCVGLGLATVQFIDCGSRNIWVVHPGNEVSAFARLPGSIIIVVGGPSVSGGLTIRSGVVLDTPQPPEIPKQRLADSRVLSPDKSFSVGSIPAKDGSYYRTAGYVIVERETHETVVRVESNDQWGVQGVAWSPDGQYLAVLKLSEDYGFCTIEAVSFIAGHPAQMKTYVLEVIDIGGNIVARTPLVSRALNADGRIAWTQ